MNSNAHPRPSAQTTRGTTTRFPAGQRRALNVFTRNSALLCWQRFNDWLHPPPQRLRLYTSMVDCCEVWFNFGARKRSHAPKR